MPDVTSLHHCLKDKQQNINAFIGMDPAIEYLVLCSLRRGVAKTCIQLFTHLCNW